MKNSHVSFDSRILTIPKPSDRPLLAALAASGVGVWYWDVLTNQVVVSKTLTELMQLQTDVSLTYLDFINVIYPEDRNSLETLLQESLDEIGSHQAVFRARTPTGEFHWFISKGLAYAGTEGKADHIFATIQDINDQTLTLESLRKSERRYHSVVEDQTELIVRWWPDGIRTFVNDSYCRYFDQTREQLIGTSFFPLIAPEDLERIKKKLSGLTPQHPVVTTEYRVIAPSGEARWHQWTDRAFFDDKGQVIEYQSVGRDITESKNAEDALRTAAAGVASETGHEFFQSLVRNLAVTFNADTTYFGIFNEADVSKVKTIAVYTNGEFVENFEYLLDGTPCENLLDKKLCTYPHSVQKLFPRDRLLQEMGIESYCGIPLISSAGKTIGLLVVLGRRPLENISAMESVLLIFAIRAVAELERLQAEEVLFKNEELLRLGLNAAKVGTWEWKIDTNEVNWSEGVEIIFGLSPGSFDGNYESYRKLIYPDDLPKIEQAITAALESDEHYRVEHRITWPDGSLRWIAGQGEVFRNADGKPVRMLGTVMDITDQKNAQEALKKSETNLAKAQEISHIGSWSWDLETGKVEWSEEMFNIYGPEHEHSKKNVWEIIDELTYPGDRERVHIITEDAIKNDKPISIEYRILRPDGSVRVVFGEGEIVFDAERNPIKRVGTVQDITERKKAEEALRLSEERFNLAIRGSTDGFWDWPDTSKNALWITPRFYELIGYEHNEFQMGFEKFRELLHPEDREHFLEAVRAHLEDQQPYDVEYRLQTKSGDYAWFRARGQAIWDKQGKPLRMSGSIQDITARIQAEAKLRASEEKFSKAFRSSPDAFMITRQQDGSIIEVNEGFERNTGYTAAEAIGRNTFEIGLWAEPEEREKLMSLLKQQGYVRDLEICMRIKSGQVRQCLTSAELITIEGVPCLVTVTRDITERKAYLANMEHQATHDSLTELPNRELLFTSIEAAIRDAKDKGNMIALFLMDLDRFKEINDTLGHHSGDNLLKQIGPRLQRHMDKNGVLIARLGGDEFAVLIGSIESEGQAINHVEQVLSIVKQSFDIDGLKVEIGASVGVSLYPQHGDNPSTLLRCADVAMYHAKQHSLGYAIYSPDHDGYSLRRLSLMTDLGSAIRENQLFLQYQPKVTVQDNEVIGFEVLVRWQHPEHGLIPPDQFIPMVETGELIKPLTLWVVDNALRQLSNWHKAGFKVNVGVNISTRNLLDEELPDSLASLLEKHAVNPAYLELEITESAIMADPERALNILTRVNGMGIQLSIDDFGTGYSSLAYLKRLPIHALKIDLSFVSNMTRSQQDKIIVQSTINLAHNLQLAVIAEGVENKEILESLKNSECDQAQGFFISRPLDSNGIEEWLQTRRQPSA